ncbi:hypothetical protein A4X13_0g4590 [Tilletia indica]|uniref:Bile salt export pump n=1 Tax=Tilletia indica TaxID=43049 RepID=A0A8T8SXP5_9BASI|nr:hypothetical protein A4X13_0g4590 [Tilletia indica]
MSRSLRQEGPREHIPIPRRRLTFGETDDVHPSSHTDSLEILSTNASIPNGLDAPFVHVETSAASRRNRTHRRARSNRPPSLDLTCSVASGSDSDHGSSIQLDLKQSGGFYTKPPPSSSSSFTDFGHSWLPPPSPSVKYSGGESSVPSHPASTPQIVTVKPTLAVLLNIASRRDLILIGVPAALCAVGSGLVPAALTHILREAFDAFAKFNPTGAPTQAVSEEAKRALKSAIGTTVWQLVLLAGATLLLNLVSMSAWTSLGERTASRARMDCYTAVSGKDIAWFDQGMVLDAQADSKGEGQSAAGLATKFSRDADDVRSAYASACGSLLRFTTTTITAFILAFIHSWKLAFVTLAAVPLAALLTGFCERASGPLLQAERNALSEAGRLVQETVTSITAVKAFNGQSTELNRLRTVLEESSRAWNRTSLVWSLRSGLASSLMLAMFVQGFWYGSHLVQTGQATAGIVMTVFWSCLLVTTSTEQALRAMLPLQKGKMAAANIRNICIIQPSSIVTIGRSVLHNDHASFWQRLGLKWREAELGSPPTTAMPIDAIPHATVPSTPVSKKLSPEQGSVLSLSPPNFKRSKSTRVAAMRKIRPAKVCSGEVSFRSVAFAYPSRPSVLTLINTDMFFPSGETTFIVGGSGSGKSTIGSLLLRLYKPLSGEIYIDNNSIAFLDPNWCLENILVLSQSPVLFDMSIHDNIAIGRTARARMSGEVDLESGIPVVSREDVIAASRTALLHEFVISLQDGYDTILGSKGLNLSGGQKQRLAIARARLCDPTILVLDESTSALDQTSRLLVHEAVKTWRARSTTIIITHDLTQIGADDYTYVMENGRVVENGYRRNIEKQRDGKFRAMLKAQAQNAPTLIISDTVSPETPTSPTGLEARASLSLAQILEQGANGNHGLESSTMLRSVGGLSLRPLSSALDPSASVPDPRRRTLPLSWVQGPNGAKRSTQGKGHLASEAEWLDKTGRAAALGRRNTRRRAISEKAELQRIVEDDRALPDEAKSHTGSSSSSFVAISRRAWTGQKRKAVTVLGLIACMISGCTMPIFSYFLARLLATMAQTGQNSKVLRFAVLTLLLAILDGICVFLRQFVMETVAELWIRHLREEAYGRVLKQSMPWFHHPDNQAEHISHCLVRDGEDARNLVGQIWGQLLAIAAMIFVAFMWAIIVGWQLTFVGLAFVPLFGVIVYLQSRALARKETINKAKRDAVTKRFFDMTANIRAIRSMALDQIFMCRFAAVDQETLRNGIRTGPIVGIGVGLAEALTYLAEAVLFYVGTILIVNGHYTFERMIVVFNLMVFAVTFSSQMLAGLPGVAKASQAVTSLERLVLLPLETEESAGNAKARLDGGIEFDNVSFRYDAAQAPVLKQISFRIQPGETVAIVGSSGCGKSTLASLLQRLHEPTSGSVKIAGIPISSLDVNWLREHLTVVAQSPTLFNMTMLDNISYGANGFPTPLLQSGLLDDSSRRQNQVATAAAWAQMDQTIRKLPAGYETRLGDEGSQLSGGQAQRVAIARALMREHAKVLILDEFTSALDRSKQADFIDLLVLRKRKAYPEASNPFGRWFDAADVSVVVVTHNLEVMQRCDRILVLSEGRIVQDGPYERLMATNGPFATLARGGEWNEST